MFAHKTAKDNVGLRLTVSLIAALLLFGCRTGDDRASAPSSASDSDLASKASVAASTEYRTPTNSRQRLEALLSPTEEVTRPSRRPSIDPNASGTTEIGSASIAIAAAEFRIMHIPTGDYDNMGLSGYLRIEDDCVYLDSLRSPAPGLSNLFRSVLSFPRGRTRYDVARERIYFLESDGSARGPFEDGDFVLAGGSPRELSDEFCSGQEAFVSHGLSRCENNSLYRLCAVRDYASQFALDVREAQHRLDRIPQLVSLLDEMRVIEADRVAAWGICHRPFFGARLFLTGGTEPSEMAQAVVEGHDDIQILVGASTQHRDLMKNPVEQIQDDSSRNSITGCE